MGILVQSSGSTRWFDHNDLNLEVLLSVEKEREKEVRDSTRKFIGIFQKEGAMVDLPKLASCNYVHSCRTNFSLTLTPFFLDQIELKYRYKYRLQFSTSHTPLVPLTEQVVV